MERVVLIGASATNGYGARWGGRHIESADIFAAADQRHLRRMIERLEAADHRQQVQPLAANVRLDVGRFKQ